MLQHVNYECHHTFSASMIFPFGGHLTISFFSNSRPHTIKCGDLSEVWTYNSRGGDGRPLEMEVNYGIALVGCQAILYSDNLTMFRLWIRNFWIGMIVGQTRCGHPTHQQGKFLWTHKTTKSSESKQGMPSDSAGHQYFWKLHTSHSNSNTGCFKRQQMSKLKKDKNLHKRQRTIFVNRDCATKCWKRFSSSFAPSQLSSQLRLRAMLIPAANSWKSAYTCFQTLQHDSRPGPSPD